MTTKKMLVPFDVENPERNINDFLYPSKYDKEFVFKGIKSEKIWENGIISFIGKPITKKDLFAKIIDAGTTIENVDELLLYLENYIEQIRSMPLGTVIQVENKEGKFR